MITRKQVSDGIKSGAIRFITDPNMGRGTVCAIGDYWFYFGGKTAEREIPSKYRRIVPFEDIVSEVLSTLDDFFVHKETFGDEYDYYEAFLQEATAKNNEGVYEIPAKASGPTVRRYILIEYVEPNINTPEVFGSYKEAYDSMRSRFLEATGSTEETFEEELKSDFENGDAALAPWSAFCQTKNHDSACWRIYETDVAV